MSGSGIFKKQNMQNFYKKMHAMYGNTWRVKCREFTPENWENELSGKQITIIKQTIEYLDSGRALNYIVYPPSPRQFRMLMGEMVEINKKIKREHEAFKITRLQPNSNPEVAKKALDEIFKILGSRKE